MSIKPVAWMYQHEEKPELVNVTDVRLNAKTRNPLYEEIPLYAIPDTHRVVPVDALNRIMELAGVALVYQPFGTKDRQNFDALLAIIEDKP